MYVLKIEDILIEKDDNRLNLTSVIAFKLLEEAKKLYSLPYHINIDDIYCIFPARLSPPGHTLSQDPPVLQKDLAAHEHQDQPAGKFCLPFISQAKHMARLYSDGR